MLFHISLYIGLGLVMVTAMALMILKIGKLLGDCPASGRAARAAAVTIATGYGMIGFGGVALVGSTIPLMDMGVIGVLPALGFAALCLGLGFGHAVATLRAVVREALTPPHAAPTTPDPLASAA
jgi:hypothetical protein